MRIEQLSEHQIAEAAAVLADAFTGYPYFEYVLRGTGKNYHPFLLELNSFYCLARFAREEHVLGLFDGDEMAGVALIAIADGRESPESLDPIRESIWAKIGDAAKARDGDFDAVCKRFNPPEPRLHLDMLAVRTIHHGRGFGRALLDRTHELSESTPGSRGVSLTTETPANVQLYKHFGYSEIGSGMVADAFRTWTMFRPNAAR